MTNDEIGVVKWNIRPCGPGEAGYQRLTPPMLLDHTSGFANLRVLEPGRKTQIHFEPVTRYAYSVQGLQLLQLVETVTRRPLEDLMRDGIFRPFDMTRAWSGRNAAAFLDRIPKPFATSKD